MFTAEQASMSCAKMTAFWSHVAMRAMRAFTMFVPSRKVRASQIFRWQSTIRILLG